MLLHPAIPQLVRCQAQAKLRRLARGFTTPRRITLSCLGLLLAVVWIGEAALSILLRETADPADVRSWLALGLMAYAWWHLLKVACCRPEAPLEWTPAEREWLCWGPFRRWELVAYRMITVGASAVLKAVAFALLMLPDLPLPMVGFVGALLSLLLLDLFRIAAEIITWGVAWTTYLRIRCVAVVVTAAALLSGLISALSQPHVWRAGETPASLGLLVQVLKSVAALRTTWVGQILEAPGDLLARLITADRVDLSLASLLAVAVGLVVAMAWCVMRLDTHFAASTAAAERAAYRSRSRRARLKRQTERRAEQLPAIPWRGGLGPLAWRQWLGARRYVTSLSLALLAPAVLACLPLFVHRTPQSALLHVVGALVFYSFVLLPAALKFDFRRDVDRLALLKTLPIRPLALVAGQLATPVLLATLFQLVVLLVTVICFPIGVHELLVAVLLLIPVNVLIFALENLIFLLYPYRLQQEGFEIFLRTTLTFTAKGLLFTMALALFAGWALIASRVANDWSTLSGKGLFLMGVWWLLFGAAVLTTGLLARAFRRFDPSQDLPA